VKRSCKGSGIAARSVETFAVFALYVSVAGGCRDQPHPIATPASSQVAAVHMRPLTDYVPAAGLRWMFVGRPRELAQHLEFMAALSRLLPEPRLAAFAAATGVDLRGLSEGCVAGFDNGKLYLARVGAETKLVRAKFEARLMMDPVVHSAGSGMWEVTGLIADTLETLLLVDQDFAGVATGDPLLARVVEGFVLGRFHKTPSALNGAALSKLPSDLASAPLRFYAPGPFSGEWARGAVGLLEQSYAVALTAVIADDMKLRVHGLLSGAFGPDLMQSRLRLVDTWTSLQNSPIGHVLGLHETTEPCVVDVTDDLLSLDVAISLARLIDGLYDVVAADISQIMGLPDR
jgi:hypothetical protein